MPRPRRHRSAADENPDFGFQIAPMIDVVFVVLVFFMALSASVRIEQNLAARLPGSVATSAAVSFPDEQVIAVAVDGQVSLNDDPLDAPGDASLPRLLATLQRLKENADAAKATVVVTIASDPQAPYQRTVDVLNALAAAKIENVSFTIDDQF